MRNIESVLTNICESIKNGENVCKRHLVGANIDYEYDKISLAFEKYDTTICVYVSEYIESEYDAYYNVNIIEDDGDRADRCDASYFSWHVNSFDRICVEIAKRVDAFYGDDDEDKCYFHKASDIIGAINNATFVRTFRDHIIMRGKSGESVIVSMKMVDGYPYAEVRVEGRNNIFYGSDITNWDGIGAIVNAVNNLLDC